MMPNLWVAKRYLPLALLISMVIAAGCSRRNFSGSENHYSSGRYAGEFSMASVGSSPDILARAVKKVYSVSSYTTWQFRREAGVTAYSLRLGTFRKAAWGVISTKETVFGTATIVGSNEGRIALLTCAHVVTSPDTLVTYFDAADDNPVHYIQSISIKENQENWVKDLSPCGSFSLLASDPSADVAILGRNCEINTDSLVSLPFHPGAAGSLGWGNFIYVFGYPAGNLVVTRGVSSPALKRPSGEFSIDALLNKGYSGGIILAGLSKGGSYELVGIVKTVSSNSEEFLKPADGQPQAADWLPYKGDTYIGKRDHIQYGLNIVVPVEVIIQFYKNNRQHLVSSGYNLDRYFLQTP